MSAFAPTELALADIVIKILGGIGALMAFIFAFQQYKKGQNWQKAQIVLSLIDSFEKEERIEMACAMLDWDMREVDVGQGKTMEFRNDMLVSALRIPVMDRTSSGEFSEEDLIIRDAFDAFFDFFHKLYSFKKSGLLNFSDLAYFYYWLELLLDVGRYKQNQNIQNAMRRYVKAYRFVGIEQLIEEWSRHPERPLYALDLSQEGDRCVLS